MRTPLTALLVLVGLFGATRAVSAQEGEDQQSGEATAAAEEGQQAETRALEPPKSTDLVFEREVFEYPRFPRRNPFVALVAAQGGPRFEQIRLRGIIYSEKPEESVALLGIGTVAEQQGGAAQPNPDATGRSRRVRVGETWGNVRVLEIRRTEILVQVEEFGLTEQRIMRMPTRGQGD